MSRRLPTCAWCGGRLRGAQVRLHMSAYPGSPQVGWHADIEGVNRRRGGLLRCASEDPLFILIMQIDDACHSRALDIARKIYKRGADRVSATRRWAEHLRESMS